jgi:hypothetical protein
MQTKILEKVARYEENLRDIPLDKLNIEYDGYYDTVRFINTESGELYKGELFDKRTGYRHDWTSAFVYTLIGEKRNYYLKHEEVRRIVKDYLDDPFRNVRQQYGYKLRVGYGNSVYGFISKNFTKTNKRDIHKFAIQLLIDYFAKSQVSISLFEKVGRYDKIIVEYLVNKNKTLEIEYGYDTGFSKYIFRFINNTTWKHNKNIEDLYRQLMLAFAI